MTWHAFLLAPPRVQQQEKRVPGQAQGGLDASSKRGFPAAASGLLLEGVLPAAGTWLTGPKGPTSFSLLCRHRPSSLAQDGVRNPTPVWDWSQGALNRT